MRENSETLTAITSLETATKVQGYVSYVFYFFNKFARILSYSIVAYAISSNLDSHFSDVKLIVGHSHDDKK